jgi:hypothetical protein
MSVLITKRELTRLLITAAELGALEVLRKHNLISQYISKQEAYRRYKRGTVDRWISEGLIALVKDGPATSKWRIDALEIEAVSKSCNIPSYLPTNER